MNLTTFQINILRNFRISEHEDAMDFNLLWASIPASPVPSYELVMDIKSPLMDRVRTHLIAELLIA